MKKSNYTPVNADTLFGMAINKLVEAEALLKNTSAHLRVEGRDKEARMVKEAAWSTGGILNMMMFIFMQKQT